MTAGIYRIRNRVNGMAYVGSTKDLVLRVRGHVNSLKIGHHDNRQLQEAWDTYGPTAFTFGILEVTEADNATLIAAEDRWRNIVAASSAGLYNRRMAGATGRHERVVRPPVPPRPRGRRPKNWRALEHLESELRRPAPGGAGSGGE